MSSSSPRVSILLPSYNGEKFIARAIASVRNQSYPDWELLVLDDGSTDRTPEIVEEVMRSDPRVHYKKNEVNMGIQKTLNIGLRVAQGEYVARIDDDDEWVDQDKLARQTEFLDRHSDHLLIGTGTIVTDVSGKEIFRFLSPLVDEEVRRTLLRRNCFTHSSVMFRRDPVREAGGYSEARGSRHVEDYELWLRLGLRGKLANLPFYSVRFTLHPSNISSRNKLTQLRRDVALVWRHRADYPASLRGVAESLSRYIYYAVLHRFIPKKAFLKLLNLYKRS